MNLYKADLHTHTVLSPCGDLEMSPESIVKKAKEKGLDILGITDHNSTLNCKVLEEVAKDYDLMILKGAEVTSKEEAHCLTFFENNDELFEFQTYLENNLPKIKNDVNRFGYQVVVDRDENIIEHVEWLLISAIDASINQIEEKVHQLNGLFIPAHIDRARYSILSQLGFVPADLNCDALELSKFAQKNEFIERNKYLASYSFIQSSDAHFISDVGTATTFLQMENRSFKEIEMALKGINERKIVNHE